MMRILIVDDEEMVREGLALVLQHAGYEVAMAENGRVALEQFQRKPADLVITDILMPEREGLETIADLRAINPALKIVAISGGARFGKIDVLNVALNFGADATLRKPVSNKQLLRVVRECLSQPSDRTAR